MSKRYLITGGAGFIGANYAARLLARDENVIIFDNLSRAGAPKNLEWLKEEYGEGSFQLIQGDVREAELLVQSAKTVDVIIHLAAQVAVTTSVTNPREDFEINALGTFNVMEAARQAKNPPMVLYASTNKVYGGMENIRVVEEEDQYSYQEFPFGIAETQPLDFHSPYGCSKGTGDQYVRDYCRIYGVPTVVLRQSCIYGPRQFGIEDQGFLAWFVIAALTHQPITIYGDGKQVRDILFVDDLLNVYDQCIDNIETVSGKIFNVGGGKENTISIWKQFAPILEDLMGRRIDVQIAGWRAGDQLVYVSDIRKAQADLGWSPVIDVQSGIGQLYHWVHSHLALFDKG